MALRATWPRLSCRVVIILSPESATATRRVRRDPWPGEKMLQFATSSAWLCGPVALLARLLGLIETLVSGTFGHLHKTAMFGSLSPLLFLASPVGRCYYA